MSLIRWEPFGELVSLREAMERLFADSFVNPTRLPSPKAVLPLDIYQTDKEVVVMSSLAGVKPEEMDISISGDVLTIKGETKTEEKIEKDAYLCQECRYGSFNRSVTLPAGLKTDKAEASFEDGILTITIPKAEAAKPRTIKVKTRGKAKAEGTVKARVGRPPKGKGKTPRRKRRSTSPSTQPSA